ncbi:hypothetical protein BKA93DRAFT_761750 [Sparassis latifolia]
MGPSKRKGAKPPPQMRSRTTRSRGKPLPDPEENSQLLNQQLRAMGLYAAPTLGDGNCLFRALSDQLYGSPSSHLKLRQDICNWIESHKQRYEPFVDDERGLDVHLQCMRQPATYGGHLELSAFAHMTRRDVKVIQPGLVYVIEWATSGGDLVADRPSTPSPSSSTSTPDDPALNDREKRRLMRERRRSEMEKLSQADSQAPVGPIYVAYHDWEHFSSIRSLRGPHSGLPNVVESPAPTTPPTPTKKPTLKAKPLSRAALKQALKPKVLIELAAPPTPSQIPLPGSRSPSPVSSSAPNSQTSQTLSFPPIPELAASAGTLPRTYRSPKRTFDESSASSQGHSESSQGAAKRAKSSSRSRLDYMLVDQGDPELDTPDLSVSGSSPASTSSLSSVPSRSGTPPPPPAPPTPVEVERRLTRRQRKVLGLPKLRPALVATTTVRRTSAGRIMIPGGRFKKSAAGRPAAEDEEGEAGAEWKHNGTGRVDVRGFRELKI